MKCAGCGESDETVSQFTIWHPDEYWHLSCAVTAMMREEKPRILDALLQASNNPLVAAFKKSGRIKP